MEKGYVKPSIHIINMDGSTVLTSSTMSIGSDDTSTKGITEADSRAAASLYWDDDE